ncbi:hypothetical protein [Agromyces mariniharenae]|uniref:Uncharacterized protein n=1 Tax=Agromyces mariniharenae TaxID=2604423 RepID=A0A5S4V560_9MICO|nr:hypothetical protein [Agromyces mariniharenae]TYL53169.1 hypothetical protein FYC51_05590 [Agromyces mariniharenae]
MRVVSSLLIAAVSLVAITGCAASQAAPSTPTESTAASPTATSTPAPEPASDPVADPADPSTWLVDAEGVGPVRLGMTLDEAVAAMPGYAVSTCPNPAVRFLDAVDAAGASLAIAAGNDGGIVLVSVWDTDGPATAEAIRIGSTVANAKTAYPGLVPSQKYTDRYTLEDTPGYITFATQDVNAGDGAPIHTISVVTGGLPPSELCG